MVPPELASTNAATFATARPCSSRSARSCDQYTASAAVSAGEGGKVVAAAVAAGADAAAAAPAEPAADAAVAAGARVDEADILASFLSIFAWYFCICLAPSLRHAAHCFSSNTFAASSAFSELLPVARTSSFELQ